MVAILTKKKPVQHIGIKQKKQLKAGALKLVFANYDEIQSLLTEFEIPKSKEKILVVFSENLDAESKKEPSLKDELEALGFVVPQDQEIESGRFKIPVSLRNQKQVLFDIQKILGVTQEEMANIVGCSARKIWSVLNEKNGGFKVKSHVNNFNQLVSLINQLLCVLEERSIKAWIRTKQWTLKNKKPLELLVSGKIEQLFQWVYVRLEGEYQ